MMDTGIFVGFFVFDVEVELFDGGFYVVDLFVIVFEIVVKGVFC